MNSDTLSVSSIDSASTHTSQYSKISKKEIESEFNQRLQSLSQLFDLRIQQLSQQVYTIIIIRLDGNHT